MNCEVCGCGFRNEKANKQIPVEVGYQLHSCPQCKLKYHKSCYGYNNESQVCDPCKDQVRRPLCHICGQKGLLKRLSDQPNQYVHVSCAVFSSSIQVISYHSMSFAVRQDKRAKDKCVICTKVGASISCLDCQASAHPNCIIQEQIQREQEQNEVDQWIFNLKFVPNNHDPNALQVTPQTLRKEMRSIQDAILSTYDKLKKKKDQVKLATEQLIESFRFPSKEAFHWTQEKKIISYCKIHMESRRIFCICRSSVNNNQMVQCEQCYEWYHYACIKKKNLRDVQYVCEACKIWTERRNNFNIDNPSLLYFEDIIIPKDVNIIHLKDLLPILLYIESICHKLPTIPLKTSDFVNLKFYKFLLASLPVQPSSVIELDNILIKEIVLEEFKQRIHNFLPNLKQKELNQQFSLELFNQLQSRGYYLELDEQKMIKSQLITRKELKSQILQGIQDGYFVEDALDQINNQLKQKMEIDTSKLFKSQNSQLQKYADRYAQGTLIKQQIHQLFEPQEPIQLELQAKDELEKILLMGEHLYRYQQGKPHKNKLQELIQQAQNNSVTFNTLMMVQDLLDEQHSLENNDTKTYLQIVEFPINSDVLQESLKRLVEKLYLDQVANQLIEKISQGQQFTAQECLSHFCIENIQKIAKENPQIKQIYQKLQDINNKILVLKKLNHNNCKDILKLIEECPLTSQSIESFKKKAFHFQQQYERLHSPISLLDLEEIQNICHMNAFDMELNQRKQQLNLGSQVLQQLQNFDEQTLAQLDSYRDLKFKDLEETTVQLKQQYEFLEKWHQISGGESGASIQQMIGYCSKEIKDELNLDQIQQLQVPQQVHPSLIKVIDNFRQSVWKIKAEKALQIPIDPKQVEILLQQESYYSDKALVNKLSSALKDYELWINKFRALDIKLDDPTSKEFQSIHNRVVQLINSHKYVDDKHQRNLWLKYMWLIWIQKANQFLNDKATLQSMRILVRCGSILRIPQNIYLDRLLQNIDIFEEISRKIREYNEQRSSWIKNKDKDDAQNRSYKQFYKYNETKPDFKNVYKLYLQAKEIPNFKIKDLQDDIMELKQVLFAFHELVRQEPDNSQYINKLNKIRTSYSLCFLKAKNFSLILIYNLIKQQSLRCFKSLTPTTELLDRLNEISLLIKVGGEEWLQRINGSYKAPPSDEIDQEFKFIDNSLQDDFEWVKWLEQDSQQVQDQYGGNALTKKVQKEQKIIKKKSQKESVQESQRKKFKSEVYSLARKFTTKINDSHIRLLESQIYMELNQDSSKYDKEYERIINYIKYTKSFEIYNYDEFKKAYQKISQQKQQQKQKVSRMQVQEIKQEIVKKVQTTQKHKIIELDYQEPIQIQREISQPLIKKEIKKPSEEQFIQIDQKDQILYNPDGQTETNNQKEKKQLMKIGEITMIVNRKQEKIIRPHLFTFDSRNCQYFPQFNIQINCDQYTQASNALEYITSKKDRKIIVGWVYSQDIEQASEIFKLAEKLKNKKMCVGYKQDNVGITLMYLDQLQRMKPTTKWIVLSDYTKQPNVIEQLEDYSNLEKLKPHLCFILYLRSKVDDYIPLIPQPISYKNIYKLENFVRVIEQHKKQKALEPLSDEEQNKEIHDLVMGIPNIQNLLA